VKCLILLLLFYLSHNSLSLELGYVKSRGRLNAKLLDLVKPSMCSNIPRIILEKGCYSKKGVFFRVSCRELYTQGLCRSDVLVEMSALSSACDKGESFSCYLLSAYSRNKSESLLKRGCNLNYRESIQSLNVLNCSSLAFREMRRGKLVRGRSRLDNACFSLRDPFSCHFLGSLYKEKKWLKFSNITFKESCSMGMIFSCSEKERESMFAELELDCDSLSKSDGRSVEKFCVRDGVRHGASYQLSKKGLEVGLYERGEKVGVWNHLRDDMLLRKKVFREGRLIREIFINVNELKGVLK